MVSARVGAGDGPIPGSPQSACHSSPRSKSVAQPSPSVKLLDVGATKIIRRELPHLTGVVIDASIGVLCPTLVTFKVGALALVKSGDSSWASWGLLIVCDCGVAALTALGAFRSKSFYNWQEGKKSRDATEFARKTEQQTQRLTTLG